MIQIAKYISILILWFRSRIYRSSGTKTTKYNENFGYYENNSGYYDYYPNCDDEQIQCYFQR